MAVVLFSGHMVDAPDRTRPRFPADRVPQVRRALDEAVTQIERPGAWAVSGLACGGDLIFAAQWIGRGRTLRAFLPRPEKEFLDESVRYAGEEWVAEYRAVTGDPKVEVVEPEEQMFDLDDPHSRNNERMLEDALEDPGPVHGLFLWNGDAADGPGGTEHQISALLAAGATVTVVDPQTSRIRHLPASAKSGTTDS